MKASEDIEYFECALIAELPKAVKVRLIVNDEDHWIPRSICSLRSVLGKKCVLEVESWFARQEEMGE